MQGKASKNIHTILTETLGEYAPWYATVKNWVDQGIRSDFCTRDAPRSERPNTVTTLHIIDHIHELILYDRRISSESIAEWMALSPERVGSFIHEYLALRKLSAKWVLKFMNT